MCTVSLIRPSARVDEWPTPGLRLRLVFSRDERLDRAPGLPPIVRPIGAMQVVMPLDPVGGGTWVAANSAGLVFAVVNDPRAAGTSGDVSRGLIVPQLAGCSTLDDVKAALSKIDVGGCRPWHALVADEHERIDVWMRGDTIATRRRPLGPATLLTSATLEPDRAAGLRLTLFAGLVARTPSPAVQDAFHAHRWPHLPELSVDMRRPDARTVSRTVIEVGENAVHLRYATESAGVRTASISRLLPASPLARAAVLPRWRRLPGASLEDRLHGLEGVRRGGGSVRPVALDACQA
jgi:hypothetical protein